MVTKWKKFSRSAWTKALLWVLVAVLAVQGLRLLSGLAAGDLSVDYSAHPYEDTDEYLQLVSAGFADALAQAKQRDDGQPQGDGALYYIQLQDGFACANQVRVTGGSWEEVDLDGMLLEGAVGDHLEELYRENGLLSGTAYYWDAEAQELYSSGVSSAEHLQPLFDEISRLTKDAGLAVSRVVVLVPSDLLARLSRAYHATLTQVRAKTMQDRYMMPMVLLLIAVLASGLWLLVTAGRSPADDGLHLVWLDCWPAEILTALGLACALGIWCLTFWMVRLSADGDRLVNTNYLIALIVGLGLLGLALLASLVRQAKAHRLWRQSLLGRLVVPVVTGDIFLRRCPPARRMALRIPAVFAGCAAVLAAGLWVLWRTLYYSYSTDSVLALMFLFGCALALAAAGWLFARQLKDSRGVAELTRQVEAAARGERVPVDLEADNPFAPACEEVAQMGRRVQESVDARLKSERMKLDLITNVSHDLKTPLTSIIGYVDLLEKQALPAEAGDYVKILRKKADRLNETVQDLFLLAKATSGSEPTPLESRDLVMAVRQVLADMEDVIDEGGIPVRTALPKTAPVLAESGKLYRVLQNLLDNAERYAMPGTRLYVSVEAGSEVTRLTMTNTAAYEMTFTAEEVMQRFARGDKSRTGDGSGLGLSIAESFMHNFGGELSLFIEGDQFTVRCLFQNAPDEAPAADGGADGAEASAPAEGPQEGGEEAAGMGLPAEGAVEAAEAAEGGAPEAAAGGPAADAGDEAAGAAPGEPSPENTGSGQTP